MPLRIENSLATVSTGYTVFEADQVLTHDQLNSVADYADDQIRLSRVRLGGVGVACGLAASVSGSTVRVTGGVGVTTDGDLLALDADTNFTRWRAYDASFPAYPPLYQGGDVNGAMFAAWELFPAGTTGSPGRPLAEFASATGRALASLSAVLLMESYRQDDDLCSGTDCDNLGARAVNTRKLLLVEPAAVSALAGGQATPAQAFASLPEIAADRPVLAPTLTTITQFAAAYRGACNAIHARLLEALPGVWTFAGPLLGGAVTAGSAAAWTGKLNGYRAAFATSGTGIQYWYDFLKDVVEAYNDFRECLFGDDTWCSPPITAFPKHLLLGDLAAAAGSTANRTGYYPSPVTSRTAGELEHARFLAQRLDALIGAFQTGSAATLEIRVTPSAWEDRPLEERAIPFYYAPGGSDPLYRHWSWRLVKRGMETSTPSYHAPSYAPAGSAAADPLAFQLGRSGFLRVEGVVGKPVQTVIDALEAKIAAANLPFTVRAVLLGTDRTRIVRKPGRRITDLHLVHQVIRKDTEVRLQDAVDFTAHYSGEVLRATDAGELFHAQEDQERTRVRGEAASKSAAVTSSAIGARTAAAGSYTQYLATASTLQQGMASTIQSAADLSFQVGPVATTHFITPLDTLAAGVQTPLLPWIDQIIRWKVEKEDTRLLFGAFCAEHPQLEHFGGVTRGGTLVLVHDTANVVIAELMLPYHCPEAPVDEEEPVLTAPPKIPAVTTPPIRTLPTRKWGFEQEWTVKEPQLRVLTDARKDVDDYVKAQTGILQQQMTMQTQFLQEEKTGWQTELVNSVAKSYETVINNSFKSLSSATEVKTRSMTAGAAYQDETLGLMAEATRMQAEAVTRLEEAAAGGDPIVERQLDGARQSLAGLVEQTATYLGSGKTSVAAGTEGARALEHVGSGMTVLQGTSAFETAKAGMQRVAGSATNAAVKTAVNKMVR